LPAALSGDVSRLELAGGAEEGAAGCFNSFTYCGPSERSKCSSTTRVELDSTVHEHTYSPGWQCLACNIYHNTSLHSWQCHKQQKQQQNMCVIFIPFTIHPCQGCKVLQSACLYVSLSARISQYHMSKLHDILYTGHVSIVAVALSASDECSTVKHLYYARIKFS